MRRIEEHLVSVVVPIHNRFALVRRAIDSICRQTYRPVELIVADDASEVPFEIPADCNLDRDRCSMIRLTANSGPGAAREAGRLCARGEFIAYLDSDDFWDPRFLERMVAALRTDPEIGFAYCIATDVYNGKPGGVCKRSHLTFRAFLPHILKERPWPTSGCLWRTVVTNELGAWLPLWSWEDLEYEFRGCCKGVRLTHVKEMLCFVERDAPGRLGATDESGRNLTSRSLALEAMAGTLSGSTWAGNVDVRKMLSNHGFTLAAVAAGSSMRATSLAGLRVGWQLSRRRTVCLPLVVLSRALVRAGRFRTAAKMIEYARRAGNSALGHLVGLSRSQRRA